MGNSGFILELQRGYSEDAAEGDPDSGVKGINSIFQYMISLSSFAKDNSHTFSLQQNAH